MRTNQCFTGRVVSTPFLTRKLSCSSAFTVPWHVATSLIPPGSHPLPLPPGPAHELPFPHRSPGGQAAVAPVPGSAGCRDAGHPLGSLALVLPAARAGSRPPRSASTAPLHHLSSVKVHRPQRQRASAPFYRLRGTTAAAVWRYRVSFRQARCARPGSRGDGRQGRHPIPAPLLPPGALPS